MKIKLNRKVVLFYVTLLFEIAFVKIAKNASLKRLEYY